MSAFRRPTRFLEEVFSAVEEVVQAFMDDIGEAFLQGLGLLLALAIIAIPFLTVAVLIKALA